MRDLTDVFQGIIYLGAFNPDPLEHPFLHRFENCLFIHNSGRVVSVNNNSANTIYQEMNRAAFLNCTFFGNDYDFRPPVSALISGAPAWFYGKAFNCILHNTAGEEVPVEGERNWEWAVQGDPGVVDANSPAGADGRWGTADDGLRLQPGAAAAGYGRMDAGAADVSIPLAGVDLLGIPRPQGDQPEPGAYEIDTGSGNTAPTATSIALVTWEDTPIAIPLTGSDRESAALNARLASLPTVGTLFPTIDHATPSGPALEAGSLVPGSSVLYWPPADAAGDGLGTFTFTIDDGALTSAPAIVWINVQEVNDPPTLDQPSMVSVDENSGFQTIPLTGISAGPGEAQGLFVTAISSDPALIPDPLVSYSSPATTAQLAFAPAMAAHGTATITVNVMDDGGTARGGSNRVSCSFTIAVVHHEAPPVLAVNNGLTADAGQSVILGPEHLRLTDADLPDSATLLFVLREVPPHGTLRRDGIILGVADSFSQRDIDDGLVAYQQDASSEPGSFIVTWRDGTPASFPDLGPAVVAIRLRGSHRPVITLPINAGAWTEGAPALAVAAAAQISDPDDLPWDGGSITALLIGGAREGDALTLATVGNGLGEIGLSGAEVSYSGRVIGTWSGGDDQPLVVQFAGGDANTAAVQAVVRTLRFHHAGRNPGTAARIMRLVVNDGSTGASAPVSSSISVIPVDDPPVLLTTLITTPAGVARELSLAASDPDSTALTWAVASPPAGADLEVLDAATGRFRLAPHPGATGSSTAVLTISDGRNMVTGILTLHLTGADGQRPMPAMEAPLEAFIGQDWTFDLPFVGIDGGSLDFTASADAPAGLVLTRLDAFSVRVAWRVPADAEAGRHLVFQIVASTADGSAAGCLPVTVLVRRPPEGSN